MNKIGWIQITVKPWHFQDRMSELRIKITDGSREITITKMMDVSDMETHFDFIFDECREQLRAEVKKALARSGT